MISINKASALIFTVLLTICMGSSAQAQRPQSQSIIKNQKLKWYTQLDLGSHSISSGSRMGGEGSFTAGARLGYQLINNFSIELQWERMKFDMDRYEDLFNGASITGADVRSHLFMVNGKYGVNWLTEKEVFYPYILVGVGQSYNDASDGQGTAATFGSKFDDSTAIQFGVGIDYLMTQEISAGLEFTQLWNEPSVEISNGGFQGKVDLGGMSFGLSFRFHF